MLRVALINLVPPKDIANYLGFNHGIGSISAVLKRAGHETRLFSYAAAKDDDASLLAFRPNALFIYLATNQYRLFVEKLGTVWRGMDVPVVVGGPHPLCVPEETARIPGVSAVCVGEGEETAVALAERIEQNASFAGVPNLCALHDGEMAWGPQGRFVEDLDSLPFPDRSIFPYERMLKDKAVRLMGFEVLCSRGCVYGCRYCINSKLRKVHGKGCVRRRSVPHVIDELKAIQRQYAYRGIVGFHDDIFTLDTEWLGRFAERYTSEIDLAFWCNAHVSELTEAIIKDLRRAGCFRVHMGIECGNEATRGTLLGKHISNDEILEKVAMLKRHHLKIVTTFMIGLPDETEADIERSIALCRAIAPDWVLLSTFCPYPGTRLYTDLVDAGRLDPRFYEALPADSFYSSTLTYDQQTVPPERLDYYFDHFRRLAGVI